MASSSSIEVFFNEEIRKKYEVQFASRPFIFDKSFDTKNKPNIGFTPEFTTVVKKHKWENFIQQRGEIYPDVIREFCAHLLTKDSPFLMIRDDMPKMESNEALVVKRTLITVVIWRQLIEVESKEKGK
ncbi:hypothetical protein V6N11_009383 [Hibiscus sabdariffa]|uniref:Uncharacterized protein n=1 Tax=Hibiscus sabdariffa TaxID=183260 RepID=A0ABR2NSV1_9ROSI